MHTRQFAGSDLACKWLSAVRSQLGPPAVLRNVMCDAALVIVGVGIDVVDVARFEESLTRTPHLRERLFTSAERGRAPASLAARFAAKEALAKALGAPAGLHWQDAEVVSEDDGRPWLDLRGSVRARADELAVATVHVSLSHDAGMASAVVVLEG